jgi:hypothetical protein
MFSITRSARKEAEVDVVIDLEEFLRSASPTVDQEPASGRPAAPSEPRLLDLDARLDQALAETFPASDPIAVSPAELRPAGC